MRVNYVAIVCGFAAGEAKTAFISERLMGLKLFFTAVDVAIGAFTHGKVYRAGAVSAVRMRAPR